MTVKAKPKLKGSFTEELLSTPIDKLVVEEGVPKTQSALVKGLQESISDGGLDSGNPIRVRQKKDDPRYYIIDGHHRFEAAKAAGLQMVKVRNHGYLSDIDSRTVALRQNLLRRKPSKKEQMDHVKYFEAAGLSVTEIARRMCLAKSSVSEYLTVAKAGPGLRAAAQKKTGEGGMSNKTALRLARMPKEEQQTAVERVSGKTEKQAEAVLGPPAARPRIITDRSQTPKPTQSIGVLMPGETLAKEYRLVSDWKERCQRLDLEVQKRIKATPSNKMLQGMELVIGVLRGKLTVEQAFVNWQKV